MNVQVRMGKIAACISGQLEPDTSLAFTFEFHPEFVGLILGTPLEENYSLCLSGATLRNTGVTIKEPAIRANKFGAWLYAMCVLVSESTFENEIAAIKAKRCKFDAFAIISQGVVLV